MGFLSSFSASFCSSLCLSRTFFSVDLLLLLLLLLLSLTVDESPKDPLITLSSLLAVPIGSIVSLASTEYRFLLFLVKAQQLHDIHDI